MSASPKTKFVVGRGKVAPDETEETLKRRRHALVECFKKGLTIKEAADVVGVSLATMSHDMEALRAMYGVPTNHLLIIRIVTGKMPEAATRKFAAIKLDIWESVD